MIEEILQPKSISPKIYFYRLENKEIVYKLRVAVDYIIIEWIIQLINDLGSKIFIYKYHS